MTEYHVIACLISLACCTLVVARRKMMNHKAAGIAFALAFLSMAVDRLSPLWRDGGDPGAFPMLTSCAMLIGTVLAIFEVNEKRMRRLFENGHAEERAEKSVEDVPAGR